MALGRQTSLRYKASHLTIKDQIHIGGYDKSEEYFIKLSMTGVFYDKNTGSSYHTTLIRDQLTYYIVLVTSKQ